MTEAAKSATSGRFPPITEAQFTAQILEVCRLFHWRTLHIRPARTSRSWRTPVAGDGIGFIDVLAIRGRRLLAAELKRTAKQRPTPAQLDWLEAFRGAGVETYVWVPDDWDEIERTLR